TTGSSGGRSQDCLLPATSAAVTTGSSGGRSQDCLLPAACCSDHRLKRRTIAAPRVEMRQSNVHYAAADAQNAECTQDPRRRISERRRQ
uniref:Clade I nitrous oxide reductase n=1 Tax=Macrostomum lignano TaxID=282301 RepID=A0A1I8IQ94_9PLAT